MTFSDCCRAEAGQNKRTEGSNVKTCKLLAALSFAITLLAAPSVVRADDKPCCEATVEAGKTCKHECCKKAAADGKVCEKCHPKKEVKR